MTSTATCIRFAKHAILALQMIKSEFKISISGECLNRWQRGTTAATLMNFKQLLKTTEHT
jgi:hypothetical protein